MKPIYEPKGAAKEYCDLALNIYTGCPHRCFYCYAPRVLHKKNDDFHTTVLPRRNILEETRKQIERENITDKLIHLCFTCDPYPLGYDSSVTREMIKLLKDSGNHVQILTKNGFDAMRDFDLLDKNDWFGITYAGYETKSWDKNYVPVEEPNSGAPYWRIKALHNAHQRKIKTWVSCEPVLNPAAVLDFIECAGSDCDSYVDMWMVGKMNYHYSEVDWRSFDERVSCLLRSKQQMYGTQYYIKESLRKEM